MKFFSFRNSIILTAFFAIITAYSVHEVVSQQAGIYGRAQIGCGGPNCHSPIKSSGTTVSIWTTAPKIEAGKTYEFMISVKNPNAKLKAGGCNISVDPDLDAALSTDDTGLRIDPTGFVPNELSHTWPKAFETGSDSAVWKFKYTAPSTTGQAHIYAGGNAVNFNGEADASDAWNLSTLTLDVVEATGGVDDATKPTLDITLYPNPASEQLKVSTTGLTTATPYLIVATNGAVLRRGTISAGTEQAIDVRTLPSGAYMFRLLPLNEKSITREFVKR